VLDRDAAKVKDDRGANRGAAVRLEDVEFAYAGKAFIRVREYISDSSESAYSLEIVQTGGEAIPAANTKTAAASTDAATGEAATAAPPALVENGIGPIGIALGLLGAAALLGGGYFLGRRQPR
jgi:hypothetical protein